MNIDHVFLIKSPRDKQQVTYIGKQIKNTSFLKEISELATKLPFGNLLIDLDPKSSDTSRQFSNIVQQFQQFLSTFFQSGYNEID